MQTRIELLHVYLLLWIGHSLMGRGYTVLGLLYYEKNPRLTENVPGWDASLGSTWNELTPKKCYSMGSPIC